MIEDESKSKPVGWADDAPLEIPDPDSVKPTDWDDEEVPGNLNSTVLNSFEII